MHEAIPGKLYVYRRGKESVQNVSVIESRQARDVRDGCKTLEILLLNHGRKCD